MKQHKLFCCFQGFPPSYWESRTTITIVIKVINIKNKNINLMKPYFIPRSDRNPSKLNPNYLSKRSIWNRMLRFGVLDEK